MNIMIMSTYTGSCEALEFKARLPEKVHNEIVYKDSLKDKNLCTSLFSVDVTGSGKTKHGLWNSCNLFNCDVHTSQ